VRGRVIPEIAITGVMGREGTGEASLMGPQAVTTLFHEFGHLVHFIISTRDWLGTSGLPEEFDFREVPSILFEGIARDPAVVRRVARHYQTGAAMPDSLLAVLTSFRSAGVIDGGTWRALMSLGLHEGVPGNIDSLVRSTFAEAQPPGPPLLALPEAPIHPEWSFWHLGGYEAAYYTYLWSGVIALDLQSRFNGGLLDTATTHRYRRLMLEPGNSRSARSMVESFLGRPFSLDAWAATLKAAP
ncbi:MAG TPA: M3 family metallopeptidase, partial [Gemmatimonadales bacterium]|nr:M3 family metallopeptidase [Gemmatimonadales bacterium]